MTWMIRVTGDDEGDRDVTWVTGCFFFFLLQRAVNRQPGSRPGDS